MIWFRNFVRCFLKIEICAGVLGFFSSYGKRNKPTKGVIQLGLYWDCTSGNKMFGGNIDARIHIISDSSIHRKVLSDRKVSMLISGIKT